MQLLNIKTQQGRETKLVLYVATTSVNLLVCPEKSPLWQDNALFASEAKIFSRGGFLASGEGDQE